MKTTFGLTTDRIILWFGYSTARLREQLELEYILCGSPNLGYIRLPLAFGRSCTVSANGYISFPQQSYGGIWPYMVKYFVIWVHVVTYRLSKFLEPHMAAYDRV